jgi:translation initiation factor IF-1
MLRKNNRQSKIKKIELIETKNSTEVIKQGRVIEAMPNAHFKIKFKDETEAIGYLAGKMKVFKIKVLVGDNVEAVLDIRGGKARIVKRL